MAPADDQSACEVEARKRKRTRSGCLNCRRKKRKCKRTLYLDRGSSLAHPVHSPLCEVALFSHIFIGDETRPTCQRCSRVGATCEWGVRVSFRQVNGFSSPQRPTTVDSSISQPAQYSILDVTDSVKRDYHHDARDDWGSMPPQEGGPYLQSPELAYHHHFVPPTPERHRDEAVPSPHVPPAMLGRLHANAGSDHGKGSPKNGPSSLMARRGRDLSAIPHPSPQSDATFVLETLSPSTHRPDTTPSSQQTEHAASQLLSLSQASPTSPILAKHTSPQTLRQPFPPYIPLEPDSEEDSLFIEGSAYLDLHSTLRHSLIQESLSAEPTRCATPSSDGGDVATDNYRDTGDEPDFILTKEQEAILWVNWLEEVSPGVSVAFHVSAALVCL